MNGTETDLGASVLAKTKSVKLQGWEIKIW